MQRGRLSLSILLFITCFYAIGKIHLFISSIESINDRISWIFAPSIDGFDLSSSALNIRGPPSISYPREAFLTFSDNKPHYLALLANLLDSVHEFSTRPIIVYGVDVEINVNLTKYPRVIKRQIHRQDCGPSVYFCKIKAIVDSGLDYGVHLEADSIVNWNIDVLFDVVHRWPYALPLAPRHPSDPENYKKFLPTFDLTMNSRTSPYIHAQFLWNYRSYPFWRTALGLMQRGHFMDANFDETGINLLLWKAQANHTLCKIDPHYTYFSAYETQQQKCTEFCHTAFILIHGSKRAEELRSIYQRVKKLRGSPYIQTTNNGFHYLNQSQYTCCYPDSRTSSIHPLICEH